MHLTKISPKSILVVLTFLFFQYANAREFSTILRKTVFNDDVEHQVGDLYDWKRHEMHLFNETKDERYLLHSQFLEYFIFYNTNSPLDKSNFERLMELMINVQHKSKNVCPDIYIAATFQIAEMTMPFAPKLAKSQLEIVFEKAAAAGLEDFISESHFILGKNYLSKQNFKTASAHFTKALKTANPDMFSRKVRAHRELAICALHFKEFSEAKKQLSAASNILAQHKVLSKNQHCVLIGVNALQGVYKYQIGEHSQAKSTLESAYNQQKVRKECIARLPSTSEALLNIYFAEGNNAKYTAVLDELEQIRGVFSGSYYELAFVKLLHEKNQKIGNEKQTSKYFKRLNEIYSEREELNTFINEQIISLLIKQQNIEADEKQAAIAKSERNKDAAIYISLILVSLVMGFGFYRKYFQKEKETKLALDKLKDSEWKKEMLLKEVKSAQDALFELNNKLNFKIDAEQTIVEKIRDHRNMSPKEIESLIKEIQSQFGETEEKESVINENIQDEKDSFFEKLKSKHPELSPQDLNLCSYVRLQLNSKEISLISGITPGSVRVYKTKLKNKLGLKYEDNLNKYLELI
jgi:hypothetical protein